MTLWKRKRVSVSKNCIINDVMETEMRFRFYSRKLNDAMETETRFVSTAIHFWKRKRVSRKRVSVSTAIHFRWPVCGQ